MLNIGPQELLLILVVALLVVGPRRLPELARSLGKGLRELRRAQDDVRKTIQVNLEDERPTAPQDTEQRLPETDRAPASPTHPTAEPSQVAEISRTLGRGLAEVRRAREEIQRSFRVDLDQPPSPGRPPRERPSASSVEEPTPGPTPAEEPKPDSAPSEDPGGPGESTSG